MLDRYNPFNWEIDWIAIGEGALLVSIAVTVVAYILLHNAPLAVSLGLLLGAMSSATAPARPGLPLRVPPRWPSAAPPSRPGQVL